jgi:heme exporter protein A
MQSVSPACRRACCLRATDLACRRGDRVLFAGVSLALQAGSACHILGANGIGKSSLIRILAGLAAPWAGAVERTGTVGLIDDRPALDPHLPLGRALDFWSGIDENDAGAAEARLGLADLLDVPVRYLSTGQRKRAALARLITQQAPIWLLDEPLNGLDSAAAELTMALTVEHLQGGGIAIVASHQPFALTGMTTLDLAEFAA